jgi:hypothetical protein
LDNIDRFTDAKYVPPNEGKYFDFMVVVNSKLISNLSKRYLDGPSSNKECIGNRFYYSRIYIQIL